VQIALVQPQVDLRVVLEVQLHIQPLQRTGADRPWMRAGTDYLVFEVTEECRDVRSWAPAGRYLPAPADT
jgi:hypothetical protein